MDGDGKPASVKEELSDTMGTGKAFPRGTPAGPTCRAGAGKPGTPLQNLQLTPSILPLCERDTIPASRARSGLRPRRKPDC